MKSRKERERKCSVAITGQAVPPGFRSTVTERESRRTKALTFVLATGLCTVCGCAGPVISSQIRSEAALIGGIAPVRQNPEGFKDKIIIVGGDIISTVNTGDEKTTLIVLDRPLNKRERPRDSQQSQGRFMMKISQFLDPEVYSKGRKVTVAGVVTGTEKAFVGKAKYNYVVIEARQVYLWPQRHPHYYRYPYPYDYYYDYWGPPWWGYEEEHERFERFRGREGRERGEREEGGEERGREKR